MRKVFLLLAIGTVLSGFVYGQTVPPGVQRFLSRNYPRWEIGRSWVVDAEPRQALETGDFNGDGKHIARNRTRIKLECGALKPWPARTNRRRRPL